MSGTTEGADGDAIAALPGTDDEVVRDWVRQIAAATIEHLQTTARGRALLLAAQRSE